MAGSITIGARRQRVEAWANRVFHWWPAGAEKPTWIPPSGDQRLYVLLWHLRHGKTIAATAVHFGLSRNTIPRWQKCISHELLRVVPRVASSGFVTPGSADESVLRTAVSRLGDRRHGHLKTRAQHTLEWMIEKLRMQPHIPSKYSIAKELHVSPSTVLRRLRDLKLHSRREVARRQRQSAEIKRNLAQNPERW